MNVDAEALYDLTILATYLENGYHRPTATSDRQTRQTRLTQNYRVESPRSTDHDILYYCEDRNHGRGVA